MQASRKCRRPLGSLTELFGPPTLAGPEGHAAPPRRTRQTDIAKEKGRQGRPRELPRGDLSSPATLSCHQSKQVRGLTGIRMAKADLNRYFKMIDRRVPIRVSQFIRWLRKPSSFAVRLVVALLLVLGGFFSFLPVLGLWMLPLGLLFIAQDVPILQKPLVSALAWVEAKWERLKVKWRNRFP